MKHFGKILVGGLVVAGVVALNLPSHIAPANTYPDPKLTPGKAETLSVTDLTASYNGLTYSQAHRNVSKAVWLAVYKEYGVTPTASTSKMYEVDHFYPLCAGGSNDISNLWLEPSAGEWGYHKKDELEAYVCRGIKTGQIDPSEAYKLITGDWVKYYQELFGSGRLGAFAAEDMEGDTE